MRRQERLLQRLLQATETMVHGPGRVVGDLSPLRQSKLHLPARSQAPAWTAPVYHLSPRRKESLSVRPSGARQDRPSGATGLGCVLEDRLLPGCPQPRTTATAVAAGKEDAHGGTGQRSCP